MTIKIAESPVRKSSRFSALDGLKALPVLVVVVAHFGWSNALPGAWIAINHFFIFSGFVITYLLLVERAKTGKISASAFYRRRLRRLLPALYTVLFALGVWGVFFAEDHMRSALRDDILATLAYVQNWHLVVISDQYFVQFGSPSMLRHAWTLSIEEQFYILIPWLFLILITYARKRTTRVLIVLALAAFSAWLSSLQDIATVDGFARAYYGTDIRMQSILVGVGAALAIGPDRMNRVPRRLPLALVNAAAWAAYAYIFWLYFNVTWTSEWMWSRGGILVTSIALVPVLLAAVDPRPMSFKRAMSLKPLVKIGLVTYGIYLWHWPIERWLSMYAPELPSGLYVLVGLALVLIVSFVSFRTLEIKVITGGLKEITGSFRSGRYLMLSSTAVILILAFFVGSVPSVESRISSGNVPQLVQGMPDYEPREYTTNISVYGDSTGYYLFDDFPQAAYPDLSIENFAVPGCDLVRADIQWTDMSRRAPELECLESRENLHEVLVEAEPDLFVLMTGSVLSVPHRSPTGDLLAIDSSEYRELVEAELEDVFSGARAAGINDLFLTTVPCREQDPSKVKIHEVDFESYYREHPEQMRHIADPQHVNDWLRDWAERADIIVLDLYDVLGCDSGYSRKIHGLNTYRDYFHFSEETAAMIWTWLAPALRDGLTNEAAH